MKNKITLIVNKNGISDVGFLKFSDVNDHLLDCRAKERIPKNAKSIILLLFPYKVKDERPKNISRYAAVPDYHKVCGKYLEKITADLKKEFCENEFSFFIDNSPIPEVYAAAAAGLGLYGKNRMLINSKWGSYVFIGEIVTDLEIEAEKSLKKCPLCGDCFKACPSLIHGTKCLSALSQQKNEPEFSEKALLRENNIVWGCDICAEVCPLNKNAQNTYIEEFVKGYRDEYVLGEEIKNRAYEWRGEKTVFRNYVNLK